MLSEVSSRQITEWIQYAKIEPFGEERADWRAALICAVLANIYRDKDKRPTPFEPKDFMPTTQERKQQTPGEMLNIAKMITISLGGKVDT